MDDADEGQRAAPPLAGEKSGGRQESGTRRIRGFAKAMRRSPTEAERRLWYGLRAKRFAGFKFRRQMPIGPYIADFACCSRRLIVELDGDQHAENARDARRDRWLADRGYRVVRFWNGQMMATPDEVMDGIWAALTSPEPFSP